MMQLNVTRRLRIRIPPLQERPDDHITAGLQLAVGLYRDTAAQLFMTTPGGFRQSEFPWDTACLML